MIDTLTAFGVNWKLLLIQGVNFGLLLILLYRYLYKPIFALLEKRQHAIERGLEDARMAGEEKEKIEKEKGAILAEAREEGGKLMEDLRREAVLQEKDIIRGAQEKSMAMWSEARAKADAERTHLMRESEKEIARMAVLASEKILRSGHST